MPHRRAIAIMALTLGALWVGAAKVPPVAGTECAGGTRIRTGEARPLGEGQAWTWVALDAQNRPLAVGITFTERALKGLPDHAQEYVLPLPAEAGSTAFDHVAVDWNPMGHIPPGIYDKPHFDFHFYMMDQRLRNTITAQGEDLARVNRVPDPALVPAGYVAVPGGEPRMGAHWYDPASVEFHGQPFTHTFIYGFYDGRMVFVEPMVSMAFLRTRPNVTAPIAQPQRYPRRAYYPTSYAVRYDPAQKQYTVALENLTLRD